MLKDGQPVRVLEVLSFDSFAMAYLRISSDAFFRSAPLPERQRADVLGIGALYRTRRDCSQGSPAYDECVPFLRRRRGLMTYGATASEIYKGAADQVAKVLGGARPNELPLQGATRFELVLNNWTAKALGITIPPSPLVRADEVIESPPPFATHISPVLAQSVETDGLNLRPVLRALRK